MQKTRNNTSTTSYPWRFNHSACSGRTKREVRLPSQYNRQLRLIASEEIITVQDLVIVVINFLIANWEKIGISPSRVIEKEKISVSKQLEILQFQKSEQNRRYIHFNSFSLSDVTERLMNEVQVPRQIMKKFRNLTSEKSIAIKFLVFMAIDFLVTNWEKIGFVEQVEIIERLPNIRRVNFLRSLESKGKYQYSRYNGLPLRYAGGKSLAVGHVIERMRDDIEVLASPFIGGASVEIACAKELGVKVYGYDIFNILTNYWGVQLHSPIKLANAILKYTPDKHCYKQIKERLKLHWTGEKKISDKIELAAHYWFNHNLSYGPGFLGWMSKIYEEPRRFERLVEKVRSFRCPLLKVKQGSFTRTIPEHFGHFLYCDPPYYLEGDSKMFRGIYPQRNFPVHHNGFDHQTLRDLLYQHKGGFILSYNDCETIREWYSEFEIQKVEWQYTLGQGETRIGKNRVENGSNNHVKQSHELLIVGKI